MLSRFHIENIYDQDEDQITYAAFDLHNNRPCIIKRYIVDEKSKLNKIKNWQVEFLNIIDHFIRLEIPSLVNIIAGGTDPIDGYPYVVFEWFPHSPLQSAADQNQKVETSQIHLLTSNCLRALEHLHDLQLVHGGLTPKSILYTSDERKDSWVLSWDPIASLLSVHGKIKYKKGAYTANELLLLAKPNPSCDLYALGKIIRKTCNYDPNMQDWLDAMSAGARERFSNVSRARATLLGQAEMPPTRKSAPITKILGKLKKKA